jgi:hypothetical protein
MRGKMEDLRGKFEDVMVTIHTASLDAQTGSANFARARAAIVSGLSAVEQLDSLLKEFMEVQPPDEDLQQFFIQFLVSSRPRLVTALDTLKVHLANTPEPEDISDDNNGDEDLLQSVLSDIPDTSALATVPYSFPSESSDEDESVSHRGYDVPICLQQEGVFESASFGYVLRENLSGHESAKSEDWKEENEGSSGSEEDEEEDGREALRRERQSMAIAQLNEFISKQPN